MRRVLAYCIFMSFIATASAQTVVQFEVRAESLEDALRTVAAQANANILYDPSLVAGRSVAAFRTEGTLDEMLKHLLDGTGLKHQYVNEKTITLVRANPQLIPASSEAQVSEKPVTQRVQHLGAAAAK